MQRLDWMYQDVSKRDENLAEEYLMGKPIDERQAAKEDAGEEKFVKQDDAIDFGEFEESEAFQRMVEDPMVKIKQMEMSKRNEAKSDNVQMAKIQALMKQIAEKKEKKKAKAEKKESKK